MVPLQSSVAVALEALVGPFFRHGKKVRVIVAPDGSQEG